MFSHNSKYYPELFAGLKPEFVITSQICLFTSVHARMSSYVIIKVLMEVALESNELAHAIVEVAEDKKASNILMLDMRELTSLADYYVLCDGTSKRQINAIQDELAKELRNAGAYRPRLEGSPESGWVLVDFGLVIAHIFTPEQREYYQLEELWRNAPTVVRIL